MRDVCEQCARFIPSWNKPVVHENHLFCSETCVEHHEIADDCAHGCQKPLECYQIPAPHQLPYIVGNAW
jgi:hypothetical protein